MAVELERMRGTFDKGLTQLDGKLDVLVERNMHTGERLLAAETAAAALAIRVTALERRVWTASGVAAALGAGGGILATMLSG
ncbi:hypothetical protein ACFT7S_28135 [Streptomyces sp. NPDC057136]|uniref:hypothetical protein n=1 Tax=Streptomyces sp. NPDC057136 TaxID=3346029 RepID=UPI0036281D2C